MNIDDIIKRLGEFDLNGFQIVKIASDKLLLLKMKYKYSKCIYVNKIQNHIEVKVDKVYDNKYLDCSIERLHCLNERFTDTDDIIDFLNIKMV